MRAATGDLLDDLGTRGQSVHGQHEHVAGSCPVERVAGRRDLVWRLRQRFGGQARAQQRIAQDPGDLAGLTAAQVARELLEHDQRRREFRCHPCKALDVGVLPIAGVAEQQSEATSPCAQRRGDLEQPAQPFRVVGVVDDHVDVTDRVAHEAPGIVACVRAETREHPHDGIRCHAERYRGERCGTEVGDVVAGPGPDGDRHAGNGTEVVHRSPQRDRKLAVAHPTGRAAGRAMRREERVFGVPREPALP